jgi:hypothetical protein
MESEMSKERLRDVLHSLVANGELTQTQADLVVFNYEMPTNLDVQELPIQYVDQAPVVGASESGKRKWLGELGGYVGGAFTLTAGLLLLGRTWSSISQTGKIGILVALAAILFGAGVLIFGVRRGDASRRLAGTLIGFGAISAAGAGGTAAPHHHELLIASLVGFLVAFFGYIRVRSASSHVALFGFSTFLVGSLSASVHLPRNGLAIVLFLVGVIWFGLAYRGLTAEKILGLTIGTGTTVLTAEFAFMNGSSLLAYSLLAIVAVSGFRIYVTSGLWPPLAGAVAATTLGVGQIVGSTLGGALGAALGLLAAGLALLTLSAWVLRRRK